MKRLNCEYKYVSCIECLSDQQYVSNITRLTSDEATGLEGVYPLCLQGGTCTQPVRKFVIHTPSPPWMDNHIYNCTSDVLNIILWHWEERQWLFSAGQNARVEH